MESIPEGAPFVVANSTRRFVVQTGLGVVLVLLGILGIAFASFSPAILLVLLFGAAVLVLSVMSLRNSGPLLAADESGVWVQAFAGPDGVRFHCWDEVDSLYVRQVSKRPPFRMLCLLPNDVEAMMVAAPPQQAATMRKSMGLVGAPYSVNLVAASMSDEHALTTLERLAAGRATIRR